MLGRTRSRTTRFTGVAAVLTLAAASVAVAAAGTANRDRQAPHLDARTQQALLSLYALDSQLHAWQSRVASLEAAAAALRQRRISLREELGAAKASLKVGQRQLALDLRMLYEHGDVDPVAVMLGAESLAKGIGQLDHLSRVADESRQIVEATTAARHRVLRSQALLAAEGSRLARSLAAARQAERSVAAAAASRSAYVSSLRAQRLRATQVRAVVATAQSAQQKSVGLQPPAPAPPPAGGRQLVVSATCYDLPGRTATGMPVGMGVVAVDPSVIPLGTRMRIPGYGKGVAADVGSGIRGRIIDLWFPTYAQCAAWGRRTVTITLY